MNYYFFQIDTVDFNQVVTPVSVNVSPDLELGKIEIKVDALDESSPVVIKDVTIKVCAHPPGNLYE